MLNQNFIFFSEIKKGSKVGLDLTKLEFSEHLLCDGKGKGLLFLAMGLENEAPEKIGKGTTLFVPFYCEEEIHRLDGKK